MTLIHPTAIVDPAADLDPTVEVGPQAIIEGPVRLGARTRVLARAMITGNVVAGEDNVFGVGSVVGMPPQHLGFKGGDNGVHIGSGNTFREYVTVHRAYDDGHPTRIGDRCYFMVNSHVAHDCTVGNDVIMVNGSLLAGHVDLADRVILSGNTGVHQFVRIGTLCMIGGLSKVVKDVPPFLMMGSGTMVVGMNTVGLRRAGFDTGTRDKIKRAYKLLYHSGLNVAQAAGEMESQFPGCEPVKLMVDFIRGSKRGIAAHSRGGESEGE